MTEPTQDPAVEETQEQQPLQPGPGVPQTNSELPPEEETVPDAPDTTVPVEDPENPPASTADQPDTETE